MWYGMSSSRPLIRPSLQALYNFTLSNPIGHISKELQLAFIIARLQDISRIPVTILKLARDLVKGTRIQWLGNS
jgi:hypothetical protein